MSQTLRDYQIKAKSGIYEAWSHGHQAVLLVLPTGGGKTSVAADVINTEINASNSTMFIAHRKELIEQCSARLDSQGVPHGIIKAGNKRVNRLPVQVASVQTLINRVRPKDWDLFGGHSYGADLIIIDEAHRALAGTYIEVVKAFPKARILGLTATPYRSDGKGLGDLFQFIVSASSPAELTRLGFLVPARVFTTPLEPDFTKIKVKRGEYDPKAVEEIMNNAKIIGDVYAQWKIHAAKRQTVIFASSCDHGKKILEIFHANGERAAYLDGTTPEEERTQILANLETGVIQVAINMGVLTEGWDCPPVSCVQIVRPTKSLGLYLQMAGRALRPHPVSGKTDCVIIDHGGNTMRHGLVTEEREITLEGDNSADQRPTMKICFACHAVYEGHKCPECGHVNKKPKREPTTEEQQYLDEMEIIADLEEVDFEKIMAKRKHEIDFLVSTLNDCATRGWGMGYAKKLFMNKFGRWPGKEIRAFPVWGPNYAGGPPQGLKFQGVTYMDPPKSPAQFTM